MRKSVLLVPVVVMLALGAGFWMGRTQTAASTPDAPATASTDAGRDANSEAGAGARDYANEDAISAGTTSTDPSAGSLVMPSADDASTPPPPRPASPTENRLLGARGLRGADEENVLLNPHFGQIIDALSREATADSLEMTRLYRERLALNLKPDPHFQIDRMACGAHLCVVTATGPVDQEQALSELMMAQTKGPKWYAAMPASLPPQGNATTTAYHLIFTIDPKYNSIEVHP